MAGSTVSEFFEKLNKDKALAAEYDATVGTAVRNAVLPAIVETAAKQGIAFSIDDLERWLTTKQEELSDEALEGVAAGASASYQPRGTSRAGWWVPAAVGAVVIVGAASGGDADDDDERVPISP